MTSTESSNQKALSFFEIYNETKTLLIVILTNLCGEKYVQNLSNGDPEIKSFELFLAAPEDIYVGIDATEAESDLDDARKLTFKSICRAFYVELVKQILKRFVTKGVTFTYLHLKDMGACYRFDFNDPVFKTATMVNPQTFVTLRNLHELFQQFPSFITTGDKQTVENEFQRLKANLIENKITTVDITWPQLLDTKKNAMDHSVI